MVLAAGDVGVRALTTEGATEGASEGAAVVMTLLGRVAAERGEPGAVVKSAHVDVAVVVGGDVPAELDAAVVAMMVETVVAVAVPGKAAVWLPLAAVGRVAMRRAVKVAPEAVPAPAVAGCAC